MNETFCPAQYFHRNSILQFFGLFFCLFSKTQPTKMHSFSSKHFFKMCWYNSLFIVLHLLFDLLQIALVFLAHHRAMIFEHVWKSQHTCLPSAEQQSGLCCFLWPQQLGGNSEDRASVYEWQDWTEWGKTSRSVCVWTIPSQKLGVRLCFTVSQNKAKSFIFTLRCTII